MQLLEKDNASLNKSIITLHRDKQHFIDEKNSEIRLMQEECA